MINEKTRKPLKEQCGDHAHFSSSRTVFKQNPRRVQLHSNLRLQVGIYPGWQPRVSAIILVVLAVWRDCNALSGTGVRPRGIKKQGSYIQMSNLWIFHRFSMKFRFSLAKLKVNILFRKLWRTCCPAFYHISWIFSTTFCLKFSNSSWNTNIKPTVDAAL